MGRHNVRERNYVMTVLSLRPSVRPSVCLSVCLSVCQTGDLCKNGLYTTRLFSPPARVIILVFLYELCRCFIVAEGAALSTAGMKSLRFSTNIG